MRVSLIAGTFYEYTIQLANGLGNGNIVQLIILGKPKKELLNMLHKNVKVVVLERPQLRSLKNLALMSSVKNALQNFRPHCVHIQGGYPWLIFIRGFLKKYKVVTTLHDAKAHPGDNAYLVSYLVHLAYKMSDCIIVHGRRIKMQLQEKFGDKRPVFVIPHGNFDIFKVNNTCREEERWILFFGRIYEYKGLKYLIKAEPLIRKQIKNFKIVIAGKGESFEKYERLIQNRKNFMIINEYVSESKMIELFQKSSLVVLPYIEASQSGVIPIAYQFKKPVVATDVGALSDVVIDGKTGLLVRPRKVKELADSIVYLLQRPKLRKKMGQAGFKFAKKELSWDRIADMTWQVYENSCQNEKFN